MTNNILMRPTIILVLAKLFSKIYLLLFSLDQYLEGRYNNDFPILLIVAVDYSC